MNWTEKDTDLVNKYYWCYTAVTSAITRNTIYGILYPKFVDLVEINLKQFNLLNEDNRQDILLFIYTTLLPKINISKLQAVQNYLYIGIKYYIISNLYRKKVVKYDEIKEDIDIYDTYSSEIDKEINTQLLHTKVLDRLNAMIEKEKTENSNKTFLLLLKKYLISNQFDERGASQYIISKMNISKQKYTAIACRLGIYTKYLNETLPNKNIVE